MTANWKIMRNTLMWLLVAVMTLGIVIASPYTVKSNAASAKTSTVTIAKANNGKWGAVKNGKIDTSKTGVYKNQYGWWYVKNGLVQFDYTGIQKNEYGWWRIEKGKVNFKSTGVFQNEYGWWRVENGKVNFNANSIYQNSYGWWKTTKGKVTFKENGVFKNNYGWWKVENSKVNFKFNGLASNQNGLWYIENGKVDFSANGGYEYDGKQYLINNGKAYLFSDLNEAVETAEEIVKEAGPMSKSMLQYWLTETKDETGYDDFTISYAVANAKVDYQQQCDLAAYEYLFYDDETPVGVSMKLLEECLLEDEAFTEDEVSATMAKVKADYTETDWNKQALAAAELIVEIYKDEGETVTREEIKEILLEEYFTESQAQYGANNVKL